MRQLLWMAALVGGWMGFSTASPPAIEWQRSFGGTNSEDGTFVRPTADGGFILGGGSSSGVSGNKTSPFYGDPESTGSGDFWLVRVDAQGNKLWDQSFGGSQTDRVGSLAQTADGGYILVGISYSPADGNKTTPAFGQGDLWVVKLGPDEFSAPPRLHSLPQTTTDIRSSGYRFLLEGVSNQNYVVDTSIDRVAWSMLGTNRLAGSTMELVDPGATNRSRQFYRARAVP